MQVPTNVLIGTIDKVTIDQGEGFYEIRVLLSVDFKNLEYVHIVEKLEAQERLELEKLSEDD
jgi:rod shape-determining protein MreC